MKYCWLLFITLSISLVCQGQTPFCGSDWQPADPHVQVLQQQLDQQAFDFFSVPASARPDDPDALQAVLTIPVVVHIIHDGGPENISDAQVQQGLAWLNAAYANTGYFDQGSGTDAGIQFCLAQRRPDGLPTNGITRNQSPLTTLTQETQDLALKNINRWDPKRYLNIWLVRDICSTSAGCGVVGYAYGAAYHGTPYDGLLIEAQFFGAVQSQMSVAAHELGHYLGLYHTFEGSCTNNNCLVDGDRVCDTPPDQSTAAVPCGQAVNTCTTDAQSGFTTDQPDMTSNFLDYGNIGCFHDFTPGQAARMNFHLDGIRHSLLDSKGCLPPCPTPTGSAFAASATTVAPGQTVAFTNTSQNAGAYQWLVNGQPFSTAISPTYTFAATGTYTVTLLAQAGNTALCDPATSPAVVIQVVCAVVADFSLSNQNPAENEVVSVTNTSQNATIYNWTVNGVVQGATLPTVTFAEAGVYTIQLTAGDGVCQHSVQQEVFVRDSCAKETFQKRYGNGQLGTHTTSAIATLADNTIVLISRGYVDSSSIFYGFYMEKLKPDGTQVWVKTIDSIVYNGRCRTITAALDGGFIVGLNDVANSRCYVAKLSVDGEVEWIQGLQNTISTQIYDLKTNANQEILVLGYVESSSSKGPLFAKYAPSGNLLWAKSFASPIVGEQWGKIAALADGGLVGVASQFNGLAAAIRLDADGNVLWRKQIWPVAGGQLRDVVVKGDNMFLCGMGAYSNIWLVRTNLNGQVLWSKSYYHNEFNADLERMIWANGGLTMVGMTIQEPFTTQPLREAFIASFDTAGTLLWNRKYVHGAGGIFHDVTALPGGYFVLGDIMLNAFDKTTGWLLKMDAFGIAGSCLTQSITLLTVDIVVSQQNHALLQQVPLTSLPISFPMLNLSITPTLLCEKACPTTVEICNNNLDDDGDGLFDCLDADCPCAEDACNPKRNNYWYFGNHAGLDFSTEPPMLRTDGQTKTGEVAATISDSQGNLLFYSDGLHIYNRFHQIMPSGTNSKTLNAPFISCFIVPHPDNVALYYVFVLDRSSTFVCAVVDMRLDGGRGDVVAPGHFASILPVPGKIQSMTATRSCTFKGYWLAVFNSDTKEMLAYRIDQNGLDPDPVISSTGTDVHDVTGQIKFSPDSKQLAQVGIGDTLFLYAFDQDFSQPGKFSMPQRIKLAQSIQYSDGVEYSPTGRYLYVSSFEDNSVIKAVYQLDLKAGSPNKIANSRVEIASEPFVNDLTHLQLAPNGKIYVAHGSTTYSEIDIIHQPDAAGHNCQYQTSGIDLSFPFIGFSNCITSDFRRPHIAFPPDAPDSICTLNSPVAYQIKNVACDVDSIRWSLVGLDGTITSNYQYADVTYLHPAQGQLIVTAFTACGQATDTLPVTVHAPFSKILNLGPDRTVCDNGVFTCHVGSGFAKYRWQNGSTDSVLTTLLPGKYWVDVYDACGNRQTDTVVIKIAPASVLALGADVQQCAGLPMTFQRPAGFAHWRWSPAAFLSCDTCASITVDPDATVTWTVLAQTADGCLSLDTLQWTIVDTLFSVRLTAVCEGQTLDLYGVQLPADTTAYFLRPSLGPGCDTLVTVQVLGLETPVATVQVQICAGQFFDFQGTLLPPDTIAVFHLPGAGCDSIVTVRVSVFPPILLTLPADSTLSIGASLTLTAAASGTGPLSFYWQPGTGLDCTDCLQPVASPLDTMTYTLLVTDGYGCAARDSITLHVNPDCQLIIPNAFTPNGDGINDWFYPVAFPCIRTVRLWRVVNRWGQVVFERRHFAPNQQDLGWDGQQQGKAAPGDVLVWMAELEYFDGRVEQRRGEVTLLR